MLGRPVGLELRRGNLDGRGSFADHMGIPEREPSSRAEMVHALLEQVARLVPSMRDRAGELDRAARFPKEDIGALHDLGGLAAPLPTRLGGLGLGTEPTGVAGLCEMLRLLGRGNMATGRIMEGHVNAVRLAMTYGTEAQKARVGRDAAGGQLFAIWVAEAGDGVRLEGLPNAQVLNGAKSFASAVSGASRAIVTARDTDGAIRMALIEVGREPRVEPLADPPQGMRATATGRVVFDAFPVSGEALLGASGDYLREPEFSAGAWRNYAVALGGLETLVDELRAQLAGRGRDTDPHQRARMGRVLISAETAALWVRKAALIAEGDGIEPGDRSGYVNLARVAVETAGLDAIRLVQQSLGLAAFMPPNPVERLARDLATWLRQPLLDQGLVDGAARFTDRELPRTDRIA
jgi:alkylation response protein AidB-like acyl-CoA dehydrogenase